VPDIAERGAGSRRIGAIDQQYSSSRLGKCPSDCATDDAGAYDDQIVCF
jgi:hypothetical protein